MTTQARIAVLVGVIVVAIGGFVLASGGGDENTDTGATTGTETTDTGATDTGATETETTPTETTETATTPAGPPTYRINVVGGKPSGGVKRIRVDKGDTVSIVVKSDVADEIHIHGYDLMKDVEAGGTARFRFKADIDGSFEIEIEDRKEQIAQLAVQP